MTYRDALTQASARLEGGDSPWLDATLLLGHAAGEPREKVLASFPDPLEDPTAREFFRLIDKRREGHPVAYLTGRKEFYGRDFFVEEGILCPRPDTEILVDGALEQLRASGRRRVHDLCTGSGCIALTLALEEPALQVSASDISPGVERVFLKNRAALLAGRSPEEPPVPFTRTSLLDGLEGPYDLIVSNPPYLTEGETRERMDQGWKEPALALDGGGDGLDLIRTLIDAAPSRLRPEGGLMIEAAPPQMEEMGRLMARAGFRDIRLLQDLAGRNRVISGTLRP